MDRFEDLRVFVRVVEAGSISGAAERLHIAMSAVSRRIAELEGRLGVQLLRRTTRQLNLTETGWGFYERAVRILADLEEAEAAVTQAHTVLHGRLRVALPLTFSLRHLNPLILEFMRLHPGINFDLDFNERQVDLLQEGFDLAIRIAKLEDSSLIARRLAGVRMVVCASPGFLTAHGEPTHPRALAELPCLTYANLREPDVWTYFDTNGRPATVRVRVRLSADNGEFLNDACVAGEGIVLMPTFIAHRDIEAGRLKPVLTRFGWPSYDAYAMYPRTRHLSRRVRAFVDFLAERLAGEPEWDRCLASTGCAALSRAPVHHDGHDAG